VLVASSKVRRSNARNADHAQNQVEISSPVFLLPFPFLLPSSYANVRFNVADNSAGPLSRGTTGNPNGNHVSVAHHAYAGPLAVHHREHHDAIASYNGE
jgi:hypothetical protein